MPVSVEKREDEPTEEVIHMWTPYRKEVGEDYDFVPKGRAYRFWFRFVRRIVLSIFPLYNRLFFGLRVHGRENAEAVRNGAVSICNHVHILDCTMVACALRKYELRWPTLQSNLEIPVVSTLVRILGGVPIPKGPKAMARFSRAVREVLDSGGFVHLYPESILSPYYAPLRSFRRGAFAYAYESGVPVLPMVLTYRKPKGRLSRFFHRRPLLDLHILEPVYPVGGGERREQIDGLREECFQRMDAAFRRYSEIVESGGTKPVAGKPE